MDEMETAHIFSTEEKLDLWGYGEWVEELDCVFFKYKNVPCEILRHRGFGHLTGYIKIPEEHPWYGKAYDDINCEVHGGLTFSEKFEDLWIIGFDCAHYDDETPYKSERLIAKINELLPKDPAFEQRRLSLEKILSSLQQLKNMSEVYHKKTYKNIQFCIDQCKSLVDQMLEALKAQIEGEAK